MKGILVFGDSIVWGRGEQPSIGWVGRLKEVFEKQDFFHVMYNLGIPGDTSTDLLERFAGESASRAKYVHEGDAFRVVLAIGTNDARCVGNPDTPETDVDTFRSNVRHLLSLAKERADDVLVLGLLPVDESRTNPFEDTYFTMERQRQYDEVLREEAASAGVDFIPLLSVFDDTNLQRMLADGLHPSGAGYAVIADKVRNRVLREF